MPRAVVDLFEVVQIEQHQREAAAGALGALDAPAQRVGEGRPIDEPGQRVARRCALQVPLRAADGADVAQHQNVADQAVLQEAGDPALDDDGPTVPVAAEEPPSQMASGLCRGAKVRWIASNTLCSARATNSLPTGWAIN